MRRVCTIGSLLLLLLSPCGVQAQSQENATIIVRVTDALSGSPIDNAQVFLLGGDTPQNSLTNAQGVLIFDVPPALYHIQVKAGGYADSPSTEVDAGEGQRLSVAVKLQLRTIASVTSHSNVSISNVGIDENSPQRKVSQSLSDALNKIAGVTVDDQIYGANSAFNISLHGADASHTGYSIDGMHVGGGAAQATNGLQDLFSGSSIDFTPSAMSSGGTVNFYTAQPSKTWSYHFTGAVGNYGNTLGSWLVTGGGGKMGFAFERTAGGKDAPLDGMYYADASGQTYEHIGGYSRIANMMKTSLTLSPVSSLKYTVMGGTNGGSYICSSLTTLLPCGQGPNSGYDSSNLMQTLGFSSLAGHVQYNLFANAGNYRYSESEPNRAVNGTPSPSFGSGEYPWFNYGLYMSSSSRRHTLSGGGYASLDTNSSTSSYNGTQTVTGSRSERYDSIWMSDKVKSNDKLALTHTISQASGTGAGSTFEVYEEMTWQPRAADAFTLGVGAGSAQPAYASSSIIGDPLSADMDCYNRSVFVEGPSDQATHQSSASYDVAWKRTWKGGFLSVDAYQNDMYGQSMRVAVPFSAMPAGIFPNGPAAYLSQLQQIWAQPTECGAMPFDPSRVYVNQYASGIGQQNRGFTINAQVALGRNVLMYPSYAATNTYLSTLDPRLTAGGSFYALGAQLPHHPLHTAGLILDGVLPHSSIEWLANAQFTSANNSQNLPPYTIYNAGLVLHAQRGSLQLLVSNVFGTHTGLFTTYQGVDPQPVAGGGTFAFATTPLAPRTITLQYDLRWRQHTSPKPASTPKPAKS